MQNNLWKIISFTLLIIFFLYIWQNSKEKNQNDNTEEIRKAPVTTMFSKNKCFKDNIKIEGNATSKNFVNISPKVGGILENIYLDEGDKVIKNKTKLFLVETHKYQKKYDISKQDLELAICNLKVNQANLTRIQAEFHKADIDFNRFKKLFEKKSVTKDQLENQNLRYLQTIAGLEHAKALVDLAKEQEKQAKSSLELAEKDLKDTVIYSPIDGVVTKKMYEEGEMGETGKTVFKINNLSLIEISAFVPDEFYQNIVAGKTKADIFFNGKKLHTAIINYKSPTINQALRNFIIKIEIENKEQLIVPGMLLDLDITFNQRKSLGVPYVSVMQKKNYQAIYTAQGGYAVLKKIKTGLQTDGWIEVLNESIKENEEIITQGHFILKDGMAIDIQKGDK